MLESKIHDLKTWPEYFKAVASGTKTFEVRKFDRNFVVGDYLKLREWDPRIQDYTGKSLFVEITYILHGFGLKEDYVVMGIKSPFRS